MKASGPSFPTI